MLAVDYNIVLVQQQVIDQVIYAYLLKMAAYLLYLLLLVHARIAIKSDINDSYSQIDTSYFSSFEKSRIEQNCPTWFVKTVNC